jgi:dihydrofolate reductase
VTRVIYSMSVSLDGYIAGPDGSLDWGTPDEELFRFLTDQTRSLAAHVLGRRLYETMLYWETADENPSLPYDSREFASIWKALPKVVFSTTLSTVEGNGRLAAASLVEEIERLRAEPGGGDIGIGGATLAGEAAQLGLIDEFQIRVCPVLLGGGIPFLPRGGRRLDLELVETRTFGSRVVVVRYRVAR